MNVFVFWFFCHSLSAAMRWAVALDAGDAGLEGACSGWCGCGAWWGWVVEGPAKRGPPRPIPFMLNVPKISMFPWIICMLKILHKWNTALSAVFFVILWSRRCGERLREAWRGCRLWMGCNPVPDDWDGGNLRDVPYERDAEHVPDVKHVDPA